MKPKNGTIATHNGVEFQYQDGVWYPTKSKGWTANADISKALLAKWQAGDYKVWDDKAEKYVKGDPNVGMGANVAGMRGAEVGKKDNGDGQLGFGTDKFPKSMGNGQNSKAGQALVQKGLAGAGVSNPTTREAQTEQGIAAAKPNLGMTQDATLRTTPNEPTYSTYDKRGIADLVGGLGDKLGGADAGKFGQAAGYLPDVFKFALGMKGANEKLPEFQVPSQFTDYENRMRELSYQGLTDAELATGRRDLERSYAYDVNSIANFAGGRPGMALANLGRAASSYQGGLNALNVADAQMQRGNLLNYGNVVNARVGMEQNAFNLKYQQAMNNKMAGAQLAADALSNIQSRRDYNQAYGDDSIYGQYQKSLLEGQEYQNSLLKYQLDHPLDINSLQIQPDVVNPLPNFTQTYAGQ